MVRSVIYKIGLLYVSFVYIYLVKNETLNSWMIEISLSHLDKEFNIYNVILYMRHKKETNSFLNFLHLSGQC